MEIQKIRRVVTGHDADGKAVVVSDTAATSMLNRPSRPGVTLTDLWHTVSSPTSIQADADLAGRPVILRPPANGSVFRVIQFDPEDPQVIASVDGASAFEAMGASADVVSNARHPYMHRTETVDYAIVLKGSITMLLDEQDVELRAGDVVVQRGTNHAWANRGTLPCFIAFVLLDAGR